MAVAKPSSSARVLLAVRVSFCTRLPVMLTLPVVSKVTLLTGALAALLARLSNPP